MKDKEKFLGDILKEFAEVQKLEAEDLQEDSKFTAGGSFMTLFCC